MNELSTPGIEHDQFGPIQPGAPLALQDAPPLPGVVFRRFWGAADAAGMAATLNAASAATGSSWGVTPEQLAHTYAHLTNCDPLRDVVVVTADGAVVAYGRASWDQFATGAVSYNHVCYVQPAWQGKGIGTTLLHYLQGRLRGYAAARPPDAPGAFCAYSSPAAAAETALLLAEGYQPTRYGYVLTRDLVTLPIPEAGVPAGLEVRPVLPEHMRLIWEADEEAFRDHFGYSPRTEEQYEEWVNDPVLIQPQLWKVAWDVERDQIAGMVRGYVNDAENTRNNYRRGYAEFISTRRPWRRRGLAKALIVQTLAMFKTMGLDHAALGVDAENPNNALALYQGLGFEVAETNIRYEKPVDGPSAH